MKKLFVFLGLVLVLLLVGQAGANDVIKSKEPCCTGYGYIFNLNADIRDRYELSVKLLDAGANIIRLDDRAIFIYVLEPSSWENVLPKVEQAIKSQLSP